MPVPYFCLEHAVAFLGDAAHARDLQAMAHVCAGWGELLAGQWRQLYRLSFGEPDGGDAAPPPDWQRAFLRAALTKRRLMLHTWPDGAARPLLVDRAATLDELKAAAAAAVGRPPQDFALALHAGTVHTLEQARPAQFGSALTLRTRHTTVEKWQALEGGSAVGQVLGDREAVTLFLWERSGLRGFPASFAPLLATEQISEPQLKADTDWWQLYEEAFPLEERDDPEDVLRVLASGRAYRAAIGHRTIGLGVVQLLKAVPCGYLLYLAVKSEFRSLSVGSKLLSFILDDVAASHRDLCVPQDASGVVWEVEPPTDGGAEAEGAKALQVKRVRFYQRLGAYIHTGRYRQPPLRGGSPLPMALMYWPASATEAGLPDADGLRRLVAAMYEENFKAFNSVPPALLESLLTAFRPEAAGRWCGLSDGVPSFDEE